MIQITDRDVVLMQWILEQKFMHVGQVRTVFWKDAKKDCAEAYRRMGKLEKAGFIKRSDQDIFKYLLYVVTKEGLKLLMAMGNTRGLTVLNDVDYTTYHHDLDVTDLRIWFHNQGFTSWVSERILAKYYEMRHLPDGMIHHDGKYLAIEYETAQKSQQRYRELAFKYELEDQVSEVLYIVKNERLKTKLKELLSSCEKVHFVTLENLRNCPNTESLSGMKFFARKGYECV